VDVFLAVDRLWCGLHRKQRLTHQEGVSAQGGFSGCCSGFQHHQSLAFSATDGSRRSRLGSPLLPDLAHLPVPMLALILFTLGMTCFLAGANVFYRDVAHILQVVLSAWFNFTPIIYAIEFIPPTSGGSSNSILIYVINGFRLAVYYGQLPRLQSVAASFVCGLVALFIGFAFFRKFQDEFVYYVLARRVIRKQLQYASRTSPGVFALSRNAPTPCASCSPSSFGKQLTTTTSMRFGTCQSMSPSARCCD